MKVLVVEDNTLVLETIADVLQLMEHNVLHAASAEEALQVIDTLDVPPDLLISDISLPGLSGHDLYRQIKERYPGCRGLLTSGLPREHHDLNGVAFIQKPFTLDSLIDNVERLVHRPASVPAL